MDDDTRPIKIDRKASPADLVAIPSGVLVFALSRLRIPELLGLDPSDVGALAGMILTCAASLRVLWPRIWPAVLRGIAALARAVRGRGPGDAGHVHAPTLAAFAGLALASLLAFVTAAVLVARCAA